MRTMSGVGGHGHVRGGVGEVGLSGICEGIPQGEFTEKYIF